MQAYYATSKDEMKLQQVPKPKIEHGTDVLVEIHAVATNPVDSKAMHKNPRARTLGYDASGVILEIGSEVKGFRVGDAVFYAGNLSRDGSFAEFQVVDSRLIAHKPSSVSHDEAAAFPLVSLTAWEALHENMKVQSGESILIFPGGGGIGSIAIQLAKLAGLKVITSASRAETADWAKKLGADVVVDHTKGLENEFKAHGLKPVKYIFNAHALASLPQFVNIIAPRGHIVCITGDAEIKTDTIGPFFIKRVTISFEMMFSRSVIGYEQEEQGKILVQISKLIDEKKLQPIAQQRFNGLQQIVEAEKAQDSGKTIGKIVLLVK